MTWYNEATQTGIFLLVSIIRNNFDKVRKTIIILLQSVDDNDDNTAWRHEPPAPAARTIESMKQCQSNAARIVYQ